MRWFRFYDEVLDDPKIQKLPVAMRWHWVNILCLANRGVPRGVLPALDAIAFALRVTTRLAAKIIEVLKAGGLLDDTPEGLMPHNWKVRQLDTETATEVGTRGNHIRWHIARGIVSPSCPYCRPESPPDIPPDIPRESGWSRDTEERRGDTETEERRMTVVLGDKGFDVAPDLLRRWAEAYPDVFVTGELRAAFEWAQANPAKRKSNWQRFLVAWLKRAQDRAPRKILDPPKVRPAILDEPPPDVRPMTAAEREEIARFTGVMR